MESDLSSPSPFFLTSWNRYSRALPETTTCTFIQSSWPGGALQGGEADSLLYFSVAIAGKHAKTLQKGWFFQPLRPAGWVSTDLVRSKSVSNWCQIWSVLIIHPIPHTHGVTLILDDISFPHIYLCKLFGVKTNFLPSSVKKGGSKEKNFLRGVVLVWVMILGWPVIKRICEEEEKHPFALLSFCRFNLWMSFCLFVLLPVVYH